MEREIEVYRVERWHKDGIPTVWPGDEYRGWLLSDAETDLRERGYECVIMGKPGRLNYLTVWAHPVSGIAWGLYAA